MSNKEWHHKSVKNLLEETGGNDPITIIKEKARTLVLDALEKGCKFSA